MKVAYQRILYILLILFFLGVIVFSVFFYLGGMDEIKVYRLEPEARTVVGKHFSTRYTDPDIQEFGKMCRTMIQDGELEGILTVVNYKSDTLEDREISQFIGVTLDEEMFEVPSGFTVREFVSSQRYAVFLGMHVLVQPRPQKIEEMILEAARENGDELQDYFFELRYEDNSLSVEGWAR